MPLLEVQDLTVEFPTRRGTLRALDRVSFAIDAGEVLGVVGESGAGKSLTGAAIIGLLEPPGRIAGGRIVLNGTRIDQLAGGSDAPDPRQADRRHLPGPADHAQSALFGRPPAGRDHADASATIGRRGAPAAPIGWLEQVGIPAAAQRVERLSAPVLRRDAPARGDRARAVRRAAAGDRRRADHGARRLGAGADHRAAHAG